MPQVHGVPIFQVGSDGSMRRDRSDGRCLAMLKKEFPRKAIILGKHLCGRPAKLDILEAVGFARKLTYARQPLN